jgi:fatty-acyl-CoA synthase
MTDTVVSYERGSDYSDVSTISRMCLRHASRCADQDAIVFGEHRRTYRELEAAAYEMARGLRALGVGPGDHVGILMPNHIEYPAIIIGASLLGAVVVTLNARYRRAELQHTIVDADLVGLITTDAVDQHVNFADRITDAFPELQAAPDAGQLRLDAAPCLRWTVLLGERRPPGFIGESEFRNRAAEISEAEVTRLSHLVGVSDVAALIYTSGTTSLPKACVLTHESIVRNWQCCSRRMGLISGDRILDPLPFFHLGGPGPMMMALNVGGTFVSMQRFDATACLDALLKEEITVLWTGFPPIAMPIINHPDRRPEHLARIRSSYCVAPTETLKVIQRHLPNGRLMTSYGLTESGGAVTWSSVEEPVELRLETNGYVVEGLEVRIDAFEQEAVLAREDEPALGEIVYRGPLTFKGYYKDAKRTAEVIDPEGWVHTGDVGFLRDDGRIFYRGRGKDMLKVGGENVAAVEIESVLAAHAAVHLVAVVAQTDELYGEVPIAFVQFVGSDEPTAEELTAFCAERLASFKVPRGFRFVNEWPMSPGETKIQKHVLREWVNAEAPA